MDSNQYIFMHFILNGILLVAIGVVGVFGNTMTVLVLRRPQMRSSMNCLLMGMAVCDIIFILSYILLWSITAISDYVAPVSYNLYHMYIFQYVYPTSFAAQTMSVYLTLIVTLERWVAVSYPLRAKSLCTYSRARWCVLGTAVFALAYNIPKYLEMKVQAVEYEGRTIDIILPDLNFVNQTYVIVYMHWMYAIVMYVVPFSALVVFNACIVRQVWRARAKRAVMSRVQQRETRLATMLLVIVLVFFLCNVPPILNSTMIVFVDPEDYEKSEFAEVMLSVTRPILTIHYSVNFIIYALFSKRFKGGFREMFCACVPQRLLNDKAQHNQIAMTNRQGVNK